MKFNRKTFLFVALAVVVGLAVFSPAPQEPVGLVVRSGSSAASKSARDANNANALPARVTATTQKAAGNASSDPAALSEYSERGILGKPQSDLFGTQSWQPPPPKVVVEPPPPPPSPQPPAFTYRFAGRFLQDGKAQWYVSKGDTPVAVKVGDNLDGYVVESIGAGAITLLYQPLGHRQSIPIPPDASPGAAAPAATLGQGAGGVAATGPQPQSGDTAPAAAVVPKPATGTARVKWDGPAQVKMGANFSVTLRAEANQPISGSALQVRFDPALLASVSVLPGKIYANESGRGFSHRVNTDGSIFVGTNLQTAAPAGDNELLILTFKPLKPGAQVEVGLTALNILGAAGRSVMHDTLASYRATVSR